jgi:antitoxin component of MazEF toxin-antitoxin module
MQDEKVIIHNLKINNYRRLLKHSGKSRCVTLPSAYLDHLEQEEGREVIIFRAEPATNNTLILHPVFRDATMTLKEQLAEYYMTSRALKKP